MEKVTYFIIDPINKSSSGITSYSKKLKEILSNSHIISPVIIAKPKDQDIESFRHSVADLINGYNGFFFYEAPETYSATLYVKQTNKSHIRLHLSKTLGSLIQGKPINKETREQEEKVIKNASVISSPSLSCLYYSSTLFEIHSGLIFNNPLLKNTEHFRTSKEIDVGFVGRWEELKGIYFLLNLIKKRTDLKFLILTDKRDIKLPSNAVLSTSFDCSNVYKKCKTVLIPSLYETSSMVALESLSYGTPIVTWSHIGVAEFFSEPLIYHAKAFDKDELNRKLNSALTESNISQHIAPIINKNNEVIIRNIERLICGVKEEEVKTHRNYALDFTLDIIREEFMEVSKKTSFNRKFNKLKNHPYLYFRDMYLKKTGKIKNRDTYSELKKIPPPPSNKQKKSHTKERRREKFFCNIDSLESITFHDYGEKLKDYRVACLLPKKQYKERKYEVILEDIYSHDDFWPLKRSNMGRGYIDYDIIYESITTSEFFDKIDLKQRSKLNNIKSILVFDPQNISFLELLSHSTTDLHLICIYTTSSSGKNIPEDVVELADTIICPQDYNTTTLPRKIYKYKEEKNINLYIRKSIQEVLPREFDYFLPIYNAFQYNRDIEHISKDEYQGLIYVKDISLIESDVSNINCARDFINILSKHTESVLVTESVYLKYKTLCDDIDNLNNLSALLLYSYKDGVLFDVKQA